MSNKNTFFTFRKNINLDMQSDGYVLVFRILGYGLTLTASDKAIEILNTPTVELYYGKN